MIHLMPLAAFADDFGPIIASIGVFMIPIIAILTAHQRKMAMIIHGNRQNILNEQNVNHAQNEALSAEVRDLKQLVYQQSIAIDSLSSKLDKIGDGTVQQRLTGGQ